RPSALYSLSLHDALPICDHILRALEGSRDVIAQRDAHVFRRIEHDVGSRRSEAAIAERLGDVRDRDRGAGRESGEARAGDDTMRSEEHTSELQSLAYLVC